MSLSPQAITWVKSFASGMTGAWANTNDQIITAANAPAVPNPEAQATVPKPFGMADLMACLDIATIGGLADLPSLPTIVDAVNLHDVPACLLWNQLLLAAGKVNPIQAAGMMAVVTATHLDPHWPAQIGLAQAIIGKPLDALDVADARASAGA